MIATVSELANGGSSVARALVGGLRRVAFVSASSVFAACFSYPGAVDDDSTTTTIASTTLTTSTEGGDTSTSTGSLPDPCVVFDPLKCEIFVPSCGCSAPYADCEGGEVEELLVLGSGSDWEIHGDWRCVIEHFRDSRPMLMELERLGTSTYITETLVLLGDGTAIVHNGGDVTFPDGIGKNWYHVRVKSPEFFENCLAAATDAEAAECLNDWWDLDLCAPVECCPIQEHPIAPPAYE